MGIGVSLILIAVGAILTWAVNASVSGVDINAIGVILMIVGARAEVDDGVGEHSHDRGEDPDRDHRREPVDEVDPAGLGARGVRQPRNQDRHQRRDRSRDHGEPHQLQHRAPAHPREA